MSQTETVFFTQIKQTLTTGTVYNDIGAYGDTPFISRHKVLTTIKNSGRHKIPGSKFAVTTKAIQ
jgi:hypothetical protein